MTVAERLINELLQESTPRHCFVYKAKDGLWYMELADREYGEKEEATTYGPFPSEDAADDYLSNFSNPGGYGVDSSGRRPVPRRSPNGQKVVSPASRRSYW